MEVSGKSVLLLLSGGKDSFLSACRLIEDDYKLYLVTYDNGCGFQSENAKHVAERLVKRYGEDNVEFLGVKSIAGTWRRFFPLYFNKKPSETANEFGEMTLSQFNCLTCRTAMYIYTIVLCRRMGVKFIAEGARRDQGFVIELDEMIDRYKALTKRYNIELLLPVHDLSCNWTLKNELLESHFVPKTLEPQCTIGFPLDKPNLDREVIEGTCNFYDKAMKDKLDGIINMLEKKMIDNVGEL